MADNDNKKEQTAAADAQGDGNQSENTQETQSKAVAEEVEMDAEDKPVEILDQEVEILDPEEDEQQSMEEQLSELQKNAHEYLDSWQRERADFANYKKRIEREQKQLTQVITGNVIKKYLEVLDDMTLAMKSHTSQENDQTWAEGFELIHRKLKRILEAEGIQLIPAENMEFDPNVHEALTNEESPDHESGQIIEVIQHGYTLGDRVLRPARVRVAR
jgi:molecular chaperone GrpE